MSKSFVGTYPARYEGWVFVTAPAVKPQAVYMDWRIPEDYTGGNIVFTIRVRQSVVDVLQTCWNLERLLLSSGSSLIAAGTQIQIDPTPSGVVNNMQDFSFTAFSGSTADRGKKARIHIARDVDREATLSGVGPNIANFTLVEVKIDYEAQ
jgi:hypothetical protein